VAKMWSFLESVYNTLLTIRFKTLLLIGIVLLLVLGILSSLTIGVFVALNKTPFGWESSITEIEEDCIKSKTVQHFVRTEWSKEKGATIKTYEITSTSIRPQKGDSNE
jgi:hypothetical protein